MTKVINCSSVGPPVTKIWLVTEDAITHLLEVHVEN